MRKKGIIILIVIIAIYAVIAFFARDIYFERALERAGQAIVGAKVEIDNFHFSLFKMRCSWSRLQAANKNDPWRNILETGKASFVLETRPLFWKRFIIKEMILHDVRSGTKRATDGSLPKKEIPPSEEPGMFAKATANLKKQMEELPVFDLSGLGKKLKIDSLIDVEKLASVQGYNKLKSFADSSFTYWESKPKPDIYLKRVKEIEDNIKSLHLDEIKDVAGLTSALKKLDDIQKKVKSLKSDVEGQHKELKTTFAALQTKFNAVQNSLKDDIKRAQQLAKLKELDVKDVSLLLFGGPVVTRVEDVLGYVALGRKYLPKAKKVVGSEKAEKPPRFKGQNIFFPFHYRYPRFLIRKAEFSAATAAGDTSRAYFLEGNLTGLTNEPAVHGKPTRFKMGVKKVSGNRYEVKGSLDHTTEVSYDSLWAAAENFALGEVKLKGSKYFPHAVEAKKGNISLAGFFIDDAIDIKLGVDASPVSFMFEKKAENKVAQIVRDVLAGLNQVTLSAQMIGEESDYKFSMNSNVDNILAGQVKKTIEKNLREAQQQVEKYVRDEVDKRRKEVEAIIEKNKQRLLDEMEKAKQKVQQQEDEIKKRKEEVEKRIEEEKNKVKDKAKKKLEGLFKKP